MANYFRSGISAFGFGGDRSLYVFKRLSLVYKVVDPNATELVLLASKILIETHPMVDTTELPRRDWLGSLFEDLFGDIVSRKASHTIERAAW